jgi:hypothetical protein
MAENYLIHLKKLINSDVALLRSLGDVIRENTAKKFSGQKVEVDFSEIRSISRAFAHELLTLKNDPELKGSSIEFTNTSPEVSKLIAIVQESQQTSYRHFRPDLMPKEVSFEEVSEYFESL